jgi:methionyl-tRNA formyltransferase
VRVVFCGSPGEAVAPLLALADSGHDLVMVVTQPDRRRGRGSALAASPVKDAAQRLGLPVRTPLRAGELTDEVRALGADVGVVVAFGQLLPAKLLATTRYGFVNVHFSLLPRWRGAAPVERAVLAGDAETGVCLMQLDEGLDTGPVYACARVPIGPEETSGELRGRLVALGTEVLVTTLPEIGRARPRPQEGEPTYAHKLGVDDFRLDPRRPARELVRVVRAGNPRPGAWATVHGRRLKVLRAHAIEGAAPLGAIEPGAEVGTTDGRLVLDQVQPEGRTAMTGTAWLAGLRDSAPVLDAP